jgi:hypothetical protein
VEGRETPYFHSISTSVENHGRRAGVNGRI